MIFLTNCQIAARLEAIADPGGIYISRQAYDQVEGKLARRYRKLGPQALKNIAKPVEVFAVEADDLSAPVGVKTSIPANFSQTVHYSRAPDGVQFERPLLRGNCK